MLLTVSDSTGFPKDDSWRELDDEVLLEKYKHLLDRSFCPDCDVEILPKDTFVFEEWGSYAKKWKKGRPVMKSLLRKVHPDCYEKRK